MGDDIEESEQFLFEYAKPTGQGYFSFHEHGISTGVLDAVQYCRVQRLGMLGHAGELCIEGQPVVFAD